MPQTDTTASLSLRRSANRPLAVGQTPVRILAYTNQRYLNSCKSSPLECPGSGLCRCVSAVFSVSECVARFIELLSLASFSVSWVIMSFAIYNKPQTVPKLELCISLSGIKKARTICKCICLMPSIIIMPPD